MKIQGVNSYSGVKPYPFDEPQWWQVSFHCHSKTSEKLRDYGKVIKDTGFINGKKLDIYSAYSREGKLLHKLYYLADSLGNWLKSKLKYYDESGNCYKTLRSER